MLDLSKDLPSRVRLGLRPATLVQSGPYAWIRDPIYAGEGCFWIGMTVSLGSLWSSLYWRVSLRPVWVVPIEEKALHAQVPGQYEAYHRRVPAIVPNLASLFIA
jgi:protein-S-isoprenylcysteine O-methyltransferase Ste14